MPKQYFDNLIISLIKDDLVNNKLISGLNNLGLNASDYHLGLSDTILTLIGLDTENDMILNLYFNLTQQRINLDLTDLAHRGEHLNRLALEVYNELLKYKN